MWPTKKIENKLYKQGYQVIAGLDEAGRGAWAGPVVAAAVILPQNLKIKGVKDSKNLTADRREKLYLTIKKKAQALGIGVVSQSVIDRQGIISATQQAFLKAVNNLQNKADYLLIDGLKIFEHSIPCSFHIKGDQKINIISAASIIAKFTRDYLLAEYHQEYPQYDFLQHKGYGTKHHRQMILNHGICPLHRKSFRPIYEALNI